MRRLLATVLVLACEAACGVRAPAPLDVNALVRGRGEVEAHRDLQIRVLAEPRDVAARLALAELDERIGRPSEAIDQLQTVEHLGGPIGIRWHDSDRARLGRLLLARARVRLARGASTALADLEHAAQLGAAPAHSELVSAQLAVAFAQLRQVDAKLRARGRATLATHAGSAKPGTDEASWTGAKQAATPAERGAFGAWLWTIGARREAYDQLAAWHGATKPPRDQTLQSAYLRALAWWSPIWLGEAAPPPAEDLVGPERCVFPGADCPPPEIDEPPLPPLAPLPPAGNTPAIAALVRYAATRIAGADPSSLVAIPAAYRRDPAVADRLGRDLVARSVDAAAAHAALGALFDAIGDPARARAAWQAAVDASPEPLFQRGLAEAAARTGDGPAALVFATAAAASSGDPAVVWAGVAAALLDSDRPVDALTASRSALDLAGPDVLPAALDTAIAASRTLARPQQADALLVERAQLAPRKKTDDSEARAAIAAHREQPTAATTARLWVASRALPRDVEVRAVLLAALSSDDPRRETIVEELVLLAGDPDPVRARAAVLALRDVD